MVLDVIGQTCQAWTVITEFCSTFMEAHGVTGHPDVEWVPLLSRATGKAVLTVDYRLAPEHPMPAATGDVLAVYRWLLETQEVSPRKIAFYGRSSGAMLVMLALQIIVSQGLHVPACGVAVSVWAPHKTQAELWQVVVGNVDANGQSTGKNNDSQDAHFNIFAGKFHGMPPLYVMVGGEEHVDRDLNASKRLAKVAQEAGVQAKLDIALHMQHCPDNYMGYVPEASDAVARAAKFIDEMLGRE